MHELLLYIIRILVLILELALKRRTKRAKQTEEEELLEKRDVLKSVHFYATDPTERVEERILRIRVLVHMYLNQREKSDAF